MENDIQLVMAKKWKDIFIDYFIEAYKNFCDKDPSSITIADIDFWTEGWIEANVKFTKMERDNDS